MANDTTVEVPVTKILAAFAANATTSQLTPELIFKVKEVVIDYCGIVRPARLIWIPSLTVSI